MELFIILIAIFAAAVLARFGIALLRADKSEAEKSASQTHSFADAIMGRVQIQNDWLPDAAVQGGMVFNKSKNRIEVCGRVSDRSLDRIFS